MKLTKKLSIIVCSLTTAFVHTTVITNTYKSAAQAQAKVLILNGGLDIDTLIDTLTDPKDINITNSDITGSVKSGDLIDISGVTIINLPETGNQQSAAQAKGKELISNGGFEIDGLTDPKDPNIPNSNITGWVKSGDPIDISGVTISNFPKTGNQGLSLGAFSGISYISQTIPTVPGQHYQLTYYLASTEEAPNLKNKFQVFINGKKVSVKKNTPFQPYTQYKLDFQAKGTSTEIKFGSIAKYAFLYLDDVSVKATPEH